LKFQTWKFLSLFEDEARVQIIKILQKSEKLCLSDIAKLLEKEGYTMRLPAVVKHVQKLEEAGILRSESGRLTDKPDARKTMYILQGKERVKKVMNQLNDIMNTLESGATYNETAKLALMIQTTRRTATEEETEKLKSLISKCESEEISPHLTTEEKENIKLWKTMLALKSEKRRTIEKSP
jgi:repressor of nif and glnA expression